MVNPTFPVIRMLISPIFRLYCLGPEMSMQIAPISVLFEAHGFDLVIRLFGFFGITNCLIVILIFAKKHCQRVEKFLEIIQKSRHIFSGDVRKSGSGL